MRLGWLMIGLMIGPMIALGACDAARAQPAAPPAPAGPRFEATASLELPRIGLRLARRGAKGVPQRTAGIWDPGTGRWKPAGQLHDGRCCHTATLLDDGRVLVVGGRVLWALDGECIDGGKPPCLVTTNTVEIW